MKKYFAEGLGTAALTLTVALSLAGKFSIPIPVLAALTLGLFVYTIGHVSGAHINPAVTIGVWSVKKISTGEALKYIVSQFIGAVVALFIVAVTVGITFIPVSGSLSTGFAELLGSFFFTFGIASVAYEKTPTIMSGIVIGGSLLLGIALAAMLGSNGVLNPAVAFGIRSFNLMYFFAPIIGCIAGMHAYKHLAVQNIF